MRINKNKGITLVALIITVVMMLILAGVSISALIGDGEIFGKVRLSTKQAKLDSMIEVVTNAEGYVRSDFSLDRNKSIDIVSLINKVKSISDIKEPDYEFTIDEANQSATITDKKNNIEIDVLIDNEDNVIINGNIVEN